MMAVEEHVCTEKVNEQKECSAMQEKPPNVWVVGLRDCILLNIPLLLYICYLHSKFYIESKKTETAKNKKKKKVLRKKATNKQTQRQRFIKARALELHLCTLLCVVLFQFPVPFMIGKSYRSLSLFCC